MRADVEKPYDGMLTMRDREKAMNEKVHTRLRRVDGYKFEIDFGEWDGKISMDEPEPLGEGTAPNAAMMLSSAVGHCLCASLLFCVGKSKGEAEDLSADVETSLVKNERGRWRIEGIKVLVKLQMDDENQKKTDRCRELFEDFCIVTASIRQGIKVDVNLDISGPA
ncbi:MAG: OsmC family protein [Thermoplasmata archaeon]|nr:OsmC family protein [Thermoplasmata archaeon]